MRLDHRAGDKAYLVRRPGDAWVLRDGHDVDLDDDPAAPAASMGASVSPGARCDPPLASSSGEKGCACASTDAGAPWDLALLLAWPRRRRV